MYGQSRLFGHASWTFQTEADLLLSTRRPYVDTVRPWHKKRLQINFRAMLWWKRKFHSWNFRFVLFHSRSKERKFQGAKSPVTAQDWACAIGRLLCDRLTVAQVSDPPAAQRDRSHAQIGQMRTTSIKRDRVLEPKKSRLTVTAL